MNVASYFSGTDRHCTSALLHKEPIGLYNYKGNWLIGRQVGLRTKIDALVPPLEHGSQDNQMKAPVKKGMK